MLETRLRSTSSQPSIQVTPSGTPVVGGTSGSVLFVDSSGNLGQDNANLFWDDANNRLGIGTASPTVVLEINGPTKADRAGVPGQYIQFFGGDTIFTAPIIMGVSAGANMKDLNIYNLYTGTLSGTQKITIGGGQLSTAPSTISSGITYMTIMGKGNSTEGNVGIGVTSPTSVLHLKAGTATASTAPLKFNSGTLLTSAEAGAVEFLTDSYYATTTTGAVRRMIVAGNTGRSEGATAAVASVATYTLGAADASFEVSMNVLVTTATMHNFTCECAYTDEGNTARVITFSFSTLAGAFLNSIINTAGAVPYEGVPLHIRCKASTAITLRTQAAGTYTTIAYNVEGVIKQIA